VDTEEDNIRAADVAAHIRVFSGIIEAIDVSISTVGVVNAVDVEH